MTDVVVQLPIGQGEEQQLFGAYLNRFMEQRTIEAERLAATADAPYLMVRSEYAADGEVKVLIFQQRTAARDFSAGWAKAKSRLPKAV